MRQNDEGQYQKAYNLPEEIYPTTGVLPEGANSERETR